MLIRARKHNTLLTTQVGLHLNLQDAFGSDWEREESDELMGLDLRGLEAREGGQEEESSRQQQDSNAQTSDHKAEDLGQESTSGREHGTQEGQGEKQPSGKESRQLKKASRRPGSLVDTGSAYQVRLFAWILKPAGSSHPQVCHLFANQTALAECWVLLRHKHLHLKQFICIVHTHTHTPACLQQRRVCSSWVILACKKTRTSLPGVHLLWASAT